ncbi:hypothetical protein FV228_24655 [Methylobacterium sp. WL18]|uniref:hypothetical protein n=1 Tax=Methylobacterium sp. WL18 TaxID=2603897 RepID=UPI0011CB7AA0|nr:hypothetical protein [Methylobacterium sp. WL18]TXN59343.1 hypothetical protein FV228_24655 [Methylobacterium sp. WL18]
MIYIAAVFIDFLLFKHYKILRNVARVTFLHFPKPGAGLASAMPQIGDCLVSTARCFAKNPLTRVLVLAVLAASVAACATKPPVEPVPLIKKG